MKARALEFTGPRTIEMVDVDVPDPRPGQALVRTDYSGISGGTEMLAYRGELPPDLPLDERIGSLAGTFAYPFRYGYSCVGTVEHPIALEGALVFAFHPHQEFFVVEGSDSVQLGDMDPRLGTLFPLVETALQVALEAGPLQDRAVAVVGLGAVGVLTSLLLLRGGARVVASEPDPLRREIAISLGVSAHPPEELPTAVEKETQGHGVPVVVEASGSPAALAESLPLLEREGTALVASWYGGKEAVLPLGAEFHRRRLTIRSTQVSTIPARLANRWTVSRRRAVTRKLMDELPLPRLATHEFPFKDATSAFEAIDRGEQGLLHAAMWYR